MPRLEPMQQPPSRSGGRRARVMRVSTSLAEINVVPLVDVMLVLLVIFMVAAPMMTTGLNVQLPKSTQSKPIGEPVTVVVPYSFRTDRTVRIGNEAIKLQFLDQRVRQALSGQLTQSVVVAGDGRTTLQDLFMIADQLQKGGVKAIAIQAQPGVAGR